MESVRSSETTANFYQAKRHRILENSTLHSNIHENIKSKNYITEQVAIALTLQTCIWDAMVQTAAGTSATLSEVSRGFLQSLQAT
jgi:hypothetical protein